MLPISMLTTRLGKRRPFEASDKTGYRTLKESLKLQGNLTNGNGEPNIKMAKGFFFI